MHWQSASSRLLKRVARLVGTLSIVVIGQGKLLPIVGSEAAFAFFSSLLERFPGGLNR